MHHEPPRKRGYNAFSITLSGGSDQALGYNPKRCGLIVSCDGNGNTVNYGLHGETLTGANGIPVSANPAMIYLGEDAVAGAITGPITVRGTLNKIVTIIEYTYLD